MKKIEELQIRRNKLLFNGKNINSCGVIKKIERKIRNLYK